MEDQNMIICRCEEVTLREILETTKVYQCSSREVKMRTRACMGYCGGRTCRPLIDSIVSEVTKESNTSEIPLGYRAPVRPVSFGSLGGDQ